MHDLAADPGHERLGLADYVAAARRGCGERTARSASLPFSIEPRFLLDAHDARIVIV